MVFQLLSSMSCKIEVIGHFVNMVLFHTRIQPDQTFRQLLNNVKENFFEAFNNQEAPFEKIVDDLELTQKVSGAPIYQIYFSYQDARNRQQNIGDLETKQVYVHSSSAANDLSFWLKEAEYSIDGAIDYSSDLFEPETIERLIDHYFKLMDSIIESPDASIASLTILTNNEKDCLSDIKQKDKNYHLDLFLLPEAERRQLLIKSTSGRKEYPNCQTLVQLFEEQVERAPQNVALISTDESLDYQELNCRINRVAHYLRNMGVREGSIVGILANRSIAMAVGLLGILKAGAAYTVLDPQLPANRIDFILEDIDSKLLLTQRELQRPDLKFSRKMICIDSDWDKISDAKDQNLDVYAEPNALAYVNYLSDSTGKPKGVQIHHRALINLVYAMREELKIADTDTIISVMPLSSDIFDLDVVLSLLTGAKLCVVEQNDIEDIEQLTALIKRFNVSLLQATPSFLRFMIESGWDGQDSLKVVCGGETLPLDLIEPILGKCQECWNFYGAAEATVWSAASRVESKEDSLLIGKPLANTQLFILDSSFQPVPPGAEGELFIGGDGLSSGYLNRPESTADKFIPHPFSDDPGARLYRTGDFARYLPDGKIEFMGRKDNLLKIHGCSVELGEIENALTTHAGIEQAVATVIENPPEEQCLVAYLKPEAQAVIDTAEILNFLRDRLPYYMIPEHVVSMESFPLTPTGNVNRKSLPLPISMVSDDRRQNVAPQTEIEKQIAQIWQEELKVKRISIFDNFFEVGGHSLLAAKMFSKMRNKLDLNLPLAILFEAPTIVELAKIVEQKDFKANWNSLVPINSKGNKPPLFLIHGAEGNVMLYRNLAKYLGGDQPVYGLQSQGLDGEKTPLTDIQSMAKSYIREIIALDSEGPYYLGGYCLGGTIALEIAQQLRQSGKEVRLLAMLETYNTQEIREKFKFFKRIYRKNQNIYFHLNNMLLGNKNNRIKFFREKAVMEISRYKVKANIFFSRLADSVNSNSGSKYQHLLINRVNDQALANYTPYPYDGELTLFKPKTFFAGHKDIHFGWKKIMRRGIDIVELPFYPRGLLNEPFVQLLAKELTRKIEEKSN